MEHVFQHVHQLAEDGDLEVLEIILKRNSKEKKFMNKNGKTVASLAITRKQFAVYDLLTKFGVFIDDEEDINELAKDFSIVEEKKLKRIHEKYSIETKLHHLRKLCSKSKLSHDVSDEVEAEECFGIICEAFKELNEVEGLETLLKFVSTFDELSIKFDFKRDSVEFMDPTNSKSVKGKCYINEAFVLIGAKGLRTGESDEERSKALGVLAHELCHFGIKIVYENTSKPYCCEDADSKNRFEDILTKCENLKSQEKFIDNVFKYPKDNQIAELIVIVPQLKALYRNDKKLMDNFRETFKELSDFYEEKVFVDLERELPLMRKLKKIKKLSHKTLSLSTSKALIRPQTVDLRKTVKNKTIKSNCPELTMNEIYHRLSRKTHFDSSLLFLSSSDLENAELLQLLTEVHSMLVKPEVFVDCSGKSKTQLQEIIKLMQSQGMDERIIFVVNDDIEVEKSDLVAHCWDHLEQEAQKNYWSSHKVNFQGRTVNLEEISFLLGLINFPISNLFAKVPTRIGKTVKFDEVKDFVERTFIKRLKRKTSKHSLTEILDSSQCRKSNLIVDKPGSGKTSVLKVIADELTKSDRDLRWIAFIDLKTHYKVFKNLKVDFEDSKATLNFICTSILCLNTFEEETFNYLYNRGQVDFLFDGFDEICPTYTSFVTELLSKIRLDRGNRLWITTRPHVAESLKKALNDSSILILELKAFTKEDQTELFRRILRKKNLEDDRLDEKIDELMKFLLSLSGFVSNPLLIKMIAKVASDNENTKIFDLNLFEVYDKFVKKMVGNCVDRGPLGKKMLSNLPETLQRLSFIKNWRLKL